MTDTPAPVAQPLSEAPCPMCGRDCDHGRIAPDHLRPGSAPFDYREAHRVTQVLLDAHHAAMDGEGICPICRAARSVPDNEGYPTRDDVTEAYRTGFAAGQNAPRSVPDNAALREAAQDRLYRIICDVAWAESTKPVGDPAEGIEEHDLRVLANAIVREWVADNAVARVSVDWGESDELGFNEPVFTMHLDDNLAAEARAAALADVTTAVSDGFQTIEADLTPWQAERIALAAIKELENR